MGGSGRCAAPKLSVIVVAYNMAREIPRTIRTLSTRMQHGIGEADYEVILIDNGSTMPFDEELCRRYIPGIRILHMPDPTPSPVPAINLGLEEARADLVGVCIDGARMVSPGLLSTALCASALAPRPVIGTIAFHLGPEVQMKSVHKGYDQHVEDELLASSGWKEDGYRLFDISVFAGSSSGGWFDIPAETNALFLKRDHWRALGGYDTGFVTPGGGLSNLDMWARAVADSDGQTIMLLGEATFHQVHGGVATNALESERGLFHDEYIRLRGHQYRKPQPVRPLLFGWMGSSASRTLPASV